MEQQNQQSQPPVFKMPQQPAPQFQPRVTASPMMDPITAVKTCFKKYFDFKGRARRSEFWWFALFGLLVSTVLSFFGLMVPAIAYVSSIFTLVMIIPLLAALYRRLHDAGHSGLWVLLMGLLIGGYFGSFIAMVGSNFTELASTTNVEDAMAMTQELVNSVQSSPALATVWVVCAFATLLLGIVLIVFACIDSKWGENKHGPSPKYK